MTDREHAKYWKLARNLFLEPGEGPLSSDGKLLIASLKLSKLLGINYLHSGYWRKIDLTDKQITLLKALAGPHRNTIIKMLEAQKDDARRTQHVLASSQGNDV